MSDPKVKVVKLSSILPDSHNANLHSERGRDLLEKSLRERGFFRPMAAAGKGNTPVMLAGNLTQEVAASIGMDEAIVIETDGKRPIVHIRTDLDPNAKEARLLGIEDNRIAAVSLNWSPEVLKSVAEEIHGTGLFTDEELKAVVEAGEEDEGSEVEDSEPQIDKAAELQKKWQVELGQLWQLGEHRLLCGDCTDKAIVSRLMGTDTAGLLHADPPYGMGKEKEGVANDNLYGPKLDAFQMRWWKTCRPFLQDNASVYIWGNAKDLWRLWYAGGLETSEQLTFRNEIVWDKGNGGFGVGVEILRQYFPTERCLFFMLGEQGFNNNADNYWEGWEPIRSYLDGERKKLGWSNTQVAAFFGFHPSMAHHWFNKSQWSMPTRENYEGLQREAKGEAFKREYEDLKREYYATRAYFDNTHDNMTDVWDFTRVIGDERWGHATPKPVDMICPILHSSLPEKGIVLEPFLGSGSTLIAAEKEKRTCRAIEIDPGWCAVAMQRYSDATGKEPKLLS